MLSGSFEGNEVFAFDKGREALSQYKTLNPDLILCDVYLNDTDGLTILEAVREVSKIPIILFTASPNKHYIKFAIENNATAFLLKQEGFVEELEFVIKSLDNIKTCYLGNNVSSMLKDSCLTRRESEIARMMSEGKTSKTIAEMLFISIATVNNHRKAIKRKLQYSNLTQLPSKLASI